MLYFKNLCVWGYKYYKYIEIVEFKYYVIKSKNELGY